MRPAPALQPLVEPLAAARAGGARGGDVEPRARAAEEVTRTARGSGAAGRRLRAARRPGVRPRRPVCSSPTPSSTSSSHPWDFLGRAAPPVGRRGRLRPAAEPGLRLPVADGSVLRARRPAGAPGVGGATAVVALVLVVGLPRRRRRSRGALGVRSDLACLLARLRLRPVAADAHHAGADLDRGLAERAGPVGPAAAGGRGRAGLAAPGGGAVGAGGRHGRRRQRRGHRSRCSRSAPCGC